MLTPSVLALKKIVLTLQDIYLIRTVYKQVYWRAFSVMEVEFRSCPYVAYNWKTDVDLCLTEEMSIARELAAPLDGGTNLADILSNVLPKRDQKSSESSVSNTTRYT